MHRNFDSDVVGRTGIPAGEYTRRSALLLLRATIAAGAGILQPCSYVSIRRDMRESYQRMLVVYIIISILVLGAGICSCIGH
jgi:hypothetical protein